MITHICMIKGEKPKKWINISHVTITHIHTTKIESEKNLKNVFFWILVIFFPIFEIK
jgi:hypothetical protein